MQQLNKSKAVIISPKIVEVTAIDGEVFRLMCPVGAFLDEKIRNHMLRLIEEKFDQHYSEDKVKMIGAIMSASVFSGLNILGINAGTRQEERTRIGARIRQIREERGIEARDLALLSGVDAANLSRIENGRYSVGLDILSKIAAALGKKIDLVDL